MGYTDRAAGTVALGPYICYEAMYPQYARGATAAGAQLLVTISNDGWFHSRAAMEQHLAAVALRTIENRRATVRATMTGITCLIDSRGRVTARATIEQPDFAVGTVRLQSGRTLYTRFGDWFALVCGLLAVGLVWGTARRRERR
jgi:apolipoprotein N-acyltransferase